MKQFKVNLTKPVQTNFLGLNAVYHGFASVPDKYGRTYPDDWAELEADRAKALGIKIARSFCHWYAYEPETNTWNWDNAAITGFYKWCARLQKRGIEVALNAGWFLPSDVFKPNYSPFAVPDNWPQSVQNYANWVSELVHELVEVRGFTNVKYLHIFTEPVRFAADDIKPDKTPLEAWGDCIKAVDETLKRDDRRGLVKLVGPNEGGGYSMMSKVAERFGEYLDIYSCHQYQNSDLLSLRDTGKFSHSGEIAISFTLPGAKYYQFVNLTAGVEYTASVYLRLKTKNYRTVTGYVQYGLFDPIDGFAQGFEAGGHTYTGRLQQFSVQSVEGNYLSSQWQKFSFTFVAEKSGRACFGVFNDIKDVGAVTLLDDAFVGPTGGENLLQAADMSDDRPWGHACAFPATLDSADYLRIFGETARSFIKDGKPFWHDEFNIAKICGNVDPESPKHGTDLARVFCGIMAGGAENAILWSLFDQIWPNNKTNNDDSFVDGDHRCGVMPVFHRSFVPKPSYYAIGLLANNFGAKGCKAYYIPFNDFLELGVNSFENGDISVLAVNSKYEPDEFNLQFSKQLNQTFYRYVYNSKTVQPTAEALPIASNGSLKVEQTLCDQLPPYSFAVYTTKKPE